MAQSEQLPLPPQERPSPADGSVPLATATMLGSSGSVDLRTAGDLATVTLNRPSKRNSLHLGMWRDLKRAMESVASDSKLRMVVLRGTEGTFSSGADLSEVLAAVGSAEAAQHYCEQVVGALLAVASCPVHTVALVEGAAVGGGAELAIATDVRVMAEDAALTFPFVRLGVVPDLLTLSRLGSLVGPAQVSWMLLSGRPVPARECQALGLAQVVVPVRGLDDRVEALLSGARAGSPAALRGIKRAASPLVAAPPPLAELVAPMVESFLGGDVQDAAERFLAR